MSDLTSQILHAVTRPSYSPVKPKVLSKRLGLTADDYPEFRRVVKEVAARAGVLPPVPEATGASLP